MSQVETAALVCPLLFLAMLLVTLAGHRLGRGRLRRDANAIAGVGTIEAAIFALLGLLTAFTFSGAYARFDARRQLIVHEANAIGTAYMRLDLLPEPAQPRLRRAFAHYVASRVAFFVALIDPPAARAELARSATLQQDIWRDTVSATAGEASGPTRMLLLPALNDMIDLTTSRTVAVQSHPPLAIFAMLFTLAIVCAALTGYGMAQNPAPSAVHVVGFAAITAITFYLILDIEYPRLGLIRLDGAHQVLVDLQAAIQHDAPPVDPSP